MMATVSKSSALPKCSFAVSREWLLDRPGLLRAIGGSLSLKDVKHIDFSRGKLAVLTVGSLDACRQLVDRGFQFQGADVKVRPYDSGSVTVRVSGCWYELSDAALSTALSCHCKILYGPDREFVNIDDVLVETDTRVFQCALTKPVPPSLAIGSGKVRVWHKNQGVLCFKCHEEGHIAKNCPLDIEKIASPELKTRTAVATQTRERPPSRANDSNDTGKENGSGSALISNSGARATSSGGTCTHVHSETADNPHAKSLDTTDPAPNNNSPSPAFTPGQASFPQVVSRGKAQRSSPDEDGFQVAHGRKAFRRGATVVPPVPIVLSDLFQTLRSANDAPLTQVNSLESSKNTPKNTPSTQISSQNCKPCGSKEEDPQVAWVKEQCERERQKLSERVRSRGS